MKRIVLAALVTSTIMAGSALAQGTNAGDGGMTMADHATMKVHFVKTTPADLTSSKLVGMDVYNNQNDKLGDVQDLVIDNGKTITGVVVSVGGFLGIGEHYVLIDPASIVISDKNGSRKAIVDTDKDNLKAAPSFTYTKS